MQEGSADRRDRLGFDQGARFHVVSGVGCVELAEAFGVELAAMDPDPVSTSHRFSRDERPGPDARPSEAEDAVVTGQPGRG